MGADNELSPTEFAALMGDKHDLDPEAYEAVLAMLRSKVEAALNDPRPSLSWEEVELRLAEHAAARQLAKPEPDSDAT